MELFRSNRKYFALTAGIALTAAAAAAVLVDGGPAGTPALAHARLRAADAPSAVPVTPAAVSLRTTVRSAASATERRVHTVRAQPPRPPGRPPATATPGSAGHADDRDEVGAGAAASSPGPTSVTGTWYGDVSCIPTAAAPKDATTFAVRCDAATGYSGAWVGHSVVTMVGTIDTAGVARLDYDEWFVGAYTGDNTTGGLHFRGSLIASAESFQADAAIIDGSCAFAGSRGRVHYEGSSAASGPYTALWVRPAHRPPADGACVPTLPSLTALL